MLPPRRQNRRQNRTKKLKDKMAQDPDKALLSLTEAALEVMERGGGNLRVDQIDSPPEEEKIRAFNGITVACESLSYPDSSLEKYDENSSQGRSTYFCINRMGKRFAAYVIQKEDEDSVKFNIYYRNNSLVGYECRAAGPDEVGQMMQILEVFLTDEEKKELAVPLDHLRAKARELGAEWVTPGLGGEAEVEEPEPPAPG
jgi:hypothetical protein